MKKYWWVIALIVIAGLGLLWVSNRTEKQSLVSFNFDL